MIVSLILKDIRAFGLQFLLFLSILLTFNLFMAINDRSASWWLFILITSGAISTMIPAYIVLERNYKGELLTGSLPVTRKEILLSKYFILFGIAISGYLCIYLIAIFFKNVLDYNDFHIFNNPVMLLIVFMYFALIINITVLLACLTKNLLVLIIADMVFLAVFILSMEKIFFRGGLPESAAFFSQGILYPALLVLIVFSIYISFKLSEMFYVKKDL